MNRPNLIPPNDEGINPPRLIRRVEVEDVDSNDEEDDDDENEERGNAPQLIQEGATKWMEIWTPPPN